MLQCWGRFDNDLQDTGDKIFCKIELTCTVLQKQVDEKIPEKIWFC
jgi:hypothetical protein